MERDIIKIDPDKCDGCGLCVEACAEGALQLVDGKAKLVSESYCDGLGDCLPECPTGAITIERRRAAPFDEMAVKRYLEQKKQEESPAVAEPPCAESRPACGCPGVETQALRPAPAAARPEKKAAPVSRLRQWPCQLQLVPVNAPYLEQAHLLLAADCTAFAYAGIHEDFMCGKVTLIACPKLDHYDYAAKLAEILKQHEIKSITVLKMDVFCCSGLIEIVKSAFRTSDKLVPWRVVTISKDGAIIAECF